MAQIGDLTNLDVVKDWLNTSGQAYPGDDDTKLAALISGASRFVRNYLVSPIVPAQYVEKRSGTGTGSMFLRNRPVLSVSALSIANVPQDAAVNSLGVGYLFDDSQVYVPGTFFPAGVLNVQITYVAGYQATASVVVPGTDPSAIDVSGISGTSQVDGTPAGSWNSDRGVVLEDGTVLAAVASDPTAGQYAVAIKNGRFQYQFNTAQANAPAIITYGYTPADLQEAVTELVGERFKTRTRIGQNSVSVGQGQTVSFSTKDMNDFIKTTLNSYKNVVPI